jgi:hypothetical protein
LISFLQDRTAAVEMENILSRPFNLNSGTPQGSPLSPLSYIIYRTWGDGEGESESEGEGESESEGEGESEEVRVRV